MIYLNNAATTLHKPPCVSRTVSQAIESMGSCARGAHDSELRAARTIYGAREALAGLFGFSHPERVVFTVNATQALNTALNGLLSPGDHVIATDWDHNCVLRPLYRLERERRVQVSFVPADRRGRLDYGAFSRLIRRETRAIVCTHASNLTGDLLELERVAGCAKAHGLLLVVDAAQTAGSVPIRMEEQGIDVLCFTGHKGLMGPQGTGGLCVVPGAAMAPLITGGTGVRSFEKEQPEQYPEHLEAGTLNGHGLAGLGAAVRFLLETGVEKVHRHELELTDRFYQGVRQLPGVEVYGDFSGDRAPVVALNLPGWDAAQAADRLAGKYDIAVRPGIHCAPRIHRALGTESRGAVRFSFGWYNTPQEIDAAIAALWEMAGPA